MYSSGDFYVEMVQWIGEFAMLLKRLRDASMDMLPLSTMSEERRQKQYLADVLQENAERQRSAEVLDFECTSDSRQVVRYTS